MKLYFAYGSNLKQERLVGRVPSARFTRTARLPAHRLSFDKRGRDGSGKATVTPAAASEVWGAIYSIDPAHWPDLDRCERGYDRVEITVLTHDGSAIECLTYVARDLEPGALPFSWYHRLVIDGAREHGLPSDYVVAVEAHAVRETGPD